MAKKSNGAAPAPAKAKRDEPAPPTLRWSPPDATTKATPAATNGAHASTNGTDASTNGAATGAVAVDDAKPARKRRRFFSRSR